MSVMRRIGKTPLVRSKTLEEALDLKHIYLKLEGYNLAGNVSDRLAALFIQKAIKQKKSVICLTGNQPLAKSISVLGKPFGVFCVYVERRFENNWDAKTDLSMCEVYQTDEEPFAFCKYLCERKGYFFANKSVQTEILEIIVGEDIAKEITYKAKWPISNIYLNASNDFRLKALNYAFQKLWAKNKICDVPSLYGCISQSNAQNNAQNNAQRNAQSVSTDPFDERGDAWLTESAGTGNEIKKRLIEITQSELKDYSNFFRKIDPGISFCTEYAYGISGFCKHAELGKVENGNHILIIDDGKLLLDVVSYEGSDMDQLADTLYGWLGEFADSREKIAEAVRAARKNGYILNAMQGSEMLGMAVLVNSGYEGFVPQYHLAYLATKEGEEGKGIATLLLEKIIEITKGDFSLHVDKNNQRAIQVYEKMGLIQAYVRMIFKKA